MIQRNTALIAASSLTAAIACLLSLYTALNCGLLSQSVSSLKCRSIAVVDSTGKQRISLDLREGAPQILIKSADQQRELRLRVTDFGSSGTNKRTEISFFNKGEPTCYIANIDSGITTINLGDSRDTNSVNLTASGVESFKTAYITLGGMTPSSFKMAVFPTSSVVELNSPEFANKLKSADKGVYRETKNLRNGQLCTENIAK